MSTIPAPPGQPDAYDPPAGAKVQAIITGVVYATDNGRKFIRYAPGMFTNIAVDRVTDLRPDTLLPEHADMDRLQLRRSWAAMSGCLIALGQHRAPDPADLALVPAAHRTYLLGHDASRKSYADTLDRLTAAADAVERAMSDLGAASNSGADVPAAAVMATLSKIREHLNPRLAGWDAHQPAANPIPTPADRPVDTTPGA